MDELDRFWERNLILRVVSGSRAYGLAQADLEERYGYDTKHAMHLFRLLRMGEEILRDGVVNVLRPDADWLLGVRNGRLDYAEVVRLAAEYEARLAALIEHSSLPAEPDIQAAEALVVELQEQFLSRS